MVISIRRLFLTITRDPNKPMYYYPGMNPYEGFPDFSRKPKTSSRKKLAVGLMGLTVVVGGCNGILAKTNRLKVTDPKKYSYDHNANYAEIPLFGKELFYSLEPFTDKDKLNPEGYPLNPVAEPSYKPNTQLSDNDLKIITARLTALGVKCQPDAIRVTPIRSDSTTTSLPTADSSVTKPLEMAICEDYGNLSVKGSSIVVPLTLRSLSDGAPQKINEPGLTDKCVEWGVTNAGFVNRDILNEMQAAGMQTESGAQYPVIIHMNSEGPNDCDTDSHITVVTHR